jgi:hypothetical protein
VIRDICEASNQSVLSWHSGRFGSDWAMARAIRPSLYTEL